MTARGVPATAPGVSRLPPAPALFAVFPRLVCGPFMVGLRLAFGFAAAACVVAAASRLRGGTPARSGGPD